MKSLSIIIAIIFFACLSCSTATVSPRQASQTALRYIDYPIPSPTSIYSIELIDMSLMDQVTQGMIMLVANASIEDDGTPYSNVLYQYLSYSDRTNPQNIIPNWQIAPITAGVFNMMSASSNGGMIALVGAGATASDNIINFWSRVTGELKWENIASEIETPALCSLQFSPDVGSVPTLFATTLVQAGQFSLLTFSYNGSIFNNNVTQAITLGGGVEDGEVVEIVGIAQGGSAILLQIDDIYQLYAYNASADTYINISPNFTKDTEYVLLLDNTQLLVIGTSGKAYTLRTFTYATGSWTSVNSTSINLTTDDTYEDTAPTVAVTAGGAVILIWPQNNMTAPTIQLYLWDGSANYNWAGAIYPYRVFTSLFATIERTQSNPFSYEMILTSPDGEFIAAVDGESGKVLQYVQFVGQTQSTAVPDSPAVTTVNMVTTGVTFAWAAPYSALPLTNYSYSVSYANGSAVSGKNMVGSSSPILNTCALNSWAGCNNVRSFCLSPATYNFTLTASNNLGSNSSSTVFTIQNSTQYPSAFSLELRYYDGANAYKSTTWSDFELYNNFSIFLDNTNFTFTNDATNKICVSVQQMNYYAGTNAIVTQCMGSSSTLEVPYIVGFNNQTVYVSNYIANETEPICSFYTGGGGHKGGGLSGGGIAAIVIILLIIVIAGGAGAWYLLQRRAKANYQSL